MNNKIPELAKLYKFHNQDVTQVRANYERNLLFKSVSVVLLKNKFMVFFLSRINML